MLSSGDIRERSHTNTSKTDLLNKHLALISGLNRDALSLIFFFQIKVFLNSWRQN